MDKMSLTYNGSIENFRALIDELRIPNNKRWKSSNGEFLDIQDDVAELKKQNEKNSGWDVVLLQSDKDIKLKSGHRKAVIQAFESRPHITSIYFRDGFEYDNSGSKEVEKIGDSFSELIEAIRKLGHVSDENEESDTFAPKKISMVNWYRKAIQLWLAGYSIKEIAKIVSKNPQTVSNRLAELRKKYGDEVVPYRRKP